MTRPNERIQFWRGYSTAMNSVDILSGQILFQEDTGDVFLDYRETHPTLPGSNDVNPNYGQLVRLKLTDTDKANIYGDTFTGQVFLFPEYTVPIEDNEAVPKKYVDDIEQDLQTQIDEHVGNQEIHITQEERDAWNNKVDKEDGKGLSTNDFTNELKDKVERSTHVEYQSAYTVDEDNADEFYDLGTISIDDTVYHIYAPVTVDIAGNAGSADKLKDPVLIDGLSFDGSTDICRFGISSSLPEDATKLVEISDYVLKHGNQLLVYFTEDNIANDIVLDVSSTGNYPIYLHNRPVEAEQLASGLYPLVFISEDVTSIPSHYEIIPGYDTQYKLATQLLDGLMSAQDKIKLDNIEEFANNYTLPIATNVTLGGVKIGDNITSEVDGTISVSFEDVVSALGYTPLSPEGFTTEDLLDVLNVFEGAVADSVLPDGTFVAGKPGEVGLVPAPEVSEATYFLCGDGTWAPETTYEPFAGPIIKENPTEDNPNEDGLEGLVPAPKVSDVDKVLFSDGSWRSVDAVAVTPITKDEIDEMLKDLVIGVGGGGSCNCEPISKDDIQEIVDNSQVANLESIPEEEIVQSFNSIFGGSNA